MRLPNSSWKALIKDVPFEEEWFRNGNLLKYSLMCAVPILISIILYSIYRHNHLDAAVLLFIAILDILVIFYSSRLPDKSKEYRIYRYAFLFQMTLIGLFLLFLIGLKGRLELLPWAFIFVSLSLIIQEKWLGPIYIGTFILGTAILGFSRYTENLYSGYDILIRSVPALFVLMVLMYGIEYARRGYRLKLENNLSELDQSGQRLRQLNQALTKENEERKRAEKMLQESEWSYRSLFENSPVSLWEEDFSGVKAVVDRLHDQGVEDFEAYFQAHPEVVAECSEQITVMNVNRATLELYEASEKEELLGSFHKLMAPESMEYFVSELVSLAQGSTGFEGEIQIKTLSGRPKTISVSLRLAPGHEYAWDLVYISILDITEERKAETERLRRVKLQGVLETAGAACHDLNQPLQTIMGQLDLLLLGLGRDMDPVRKRTEAVLEEIERITDITRKLSRITSVESVDYVSGQKILDLERSSED